MYQEFIFNKTTEQIRDILEVQSGVIKLTGYQPYLILSTSTHDNLRNMGVFKTVEDYGEDTTEDTDNLRENNQNQEDMSIYRILFDEKLPFGVISIR